MPDEYSRSVLWMTKERALLATMLSHMRSKSGVDENLSVQYHRQAKKTRYWFLWDGCTGLARFGLSWRYYADWTLNLVSYKPVQGSLLRPVIPCIHVKISSTSKTWDMSDIWLFFMKFQTIPSFLQPAAYWNWWLVIGFLNSPLNFSDPVIYSGSHPTLRQIYWDLGNFYMLWKITKTKRGEWNRHSTIFQWMAPVNHDSKSVQISYIRFEFFKILIVAIG